MVEMEEEEEEEEKEEEITERHELHLHCMHPKHATSSIAPSSSSPQPMTHSMCSVRLNLRPTLSIWQAGSGSGTPHTVSSCRWRKAGRAAAARRVMDLSKLHSWLDACAAAGGVMLPMMTMLTLLHVTLPPLLLTRDGDGKDAAAAAVAAGDDNKGDDLE